MKQNDQTLNKLLTSGSLQASGNYISLPSVNMYVSEMIIVIYMLKS